MKIYFGDVFPVRKVFITLESEISDNQDETTSLSLINSDYTETPIISLSDLNQNSVNTLNTTETSQIKKYKIYCQERESIGIKVYKAANVGLWCLSEVVAHVKKAYSEPLQPGRYNMCRELGE